jgi:hypothetical protein
VAHINVAGKHHTARWQQEEQRWLVSEAESNITASSLHLSVEFVDTPVARLPASLTPTTSPNGSGSSVSMQDPSAAGSSGHHHHHMSLLLRAVDCTVVPAPLLFLGSDGTGVGPAVSGDSQQQFKIIYCFARGCWGTCLPVEVFAVEVAEESSGDEAALQEEEGAGPSMGLGCKGATSMIAVTVRFILPRKRVPASYHHSCTDWARAAAHQPAACHHSCAASGDTAHPPAGMDSLQVDISLLSSARAGSVQLELWHGHQVLATAPLLLLPPGPITQGPDTLLEELQQCAHQCAWTPETSPPPPSPLPAPPPPVDPLCSLSAWVPGPPLTTTLAGSEPPSGAQAWLTDLGQLLFAGACIDQASRGTSLDGVLTGGPAGQREGAAPSSNDPGSWGGVVASTVKQHTDNPAMLCSMLHLAEGLQELSAAEGYVATTALITSLTNRVRDRLRQLGDGSQPTSDDFQLAVVMPHDQQHHQLPGSGHPWSDHSKR